MCPIIDCVLDFIDFDSEIFFHPVFSINYAKQLHFLFY